MTKLFGMDLSDPEHVRSTLLLMTIFFVIYYGVYKFLRRKVNISSEYEIRLLTFFHGVFSTVCALHYVVLPSLGFYEGTDQLQFATFGSILDCVYVIRNSPVIRIVNE